VKIRNVEISNQEDLTLTKCPNCPGGFAVAAYNKTYSGMLEAHCFDCNTPIYFYTSKQGEQRVTFALEKVETETGHVHSDASKV